MAAALALAPHWTAHYVGLPWVLGESDCACLAVRVQREVFGREVGLPTERAADAGAWERTIADLSADYATPVAEPHEGCGVLVRVLGADCHIGTATRIGGEWWVLHTLERHGAMVHRARDFRRLGLRIEGWYAWR